MVVKLRGIWIMGVVVEPRTNNLAGEPSLHPRAVSSSNNCSSTGRADTWRQQQRGEASQKGGVRKRREESGLPDCEGDDGSRQTWLD